MALQWRTQRAAWGSRRGGLNVMADMARVLPGSHPSRRQHSSVTRSMALNWSDLNLAAKLAKWAGYCYWPERELQELVAAEGLDLVASGRTAYTSWYVADGSVDHGPLMRVARAAVPGIPSSTLDAVKSPVQRSRFIFIRGVQWSAPDMHALSVSQALMNFWPSPFPPPASLSHSSVNSESEPLVSHTGVTLLAADLHKQLLPYLVAPAAPAADTAGQSTANRPVGETNGAEFAAIPGSRGSSQSTAGHGAGHATECLPVCFAGHSLGGALGMLVMAQSVLGGQCKPGLVSCHTFGSPPVLAHRDGGGGHRVLQALGLPDSAAVSFVLEHDPVPRALLTADPAFHALKQYGPARQLLAMRGWLAASGGLPLFTSGLRGVLPAWMSGAGAAESAQGASSPPGARDGGAPNNNTPRSQGTQPAAPVPPPSPASAASAAAAAAGSVLSSAFGGVFGRRAPPPGASPPPGSALPASASSITGQQGTGTDSSGAASGSTANTPTSGVGAAPILSSGRFMFENVGHVYLMKGGAELVHIGSAADVEELMRLAAADFVAQPAKAVQAWLDHHHASYHHDLDTAALRALKRRLRAVWLSQGGHNGHNGVTQAGEGGDHARVRPTESGAASASLDHRRQHHTDAARKAPHPPATAVQVNDGPRAAHEPAAPDSRRYGVRSAAHLVGHSTRRTRAAPVPPHSSGTPHSTEGRPTGGLREPGEGVQEPAGPAPHPLATPDEVTPGADQAEVVVALAGRGGAHRAVRGSSEAGAADPQ